MDVFLDPQFDAAYRQHPLVLVDAGARGGLKKNWQAAARHLRVIGFEPDPKEHRQLVERASGDGESRVFLDVALHNRRGPLRLHVARDRGLTSIFEPDRTFLDAFPDADRFDTIDRAEVQADRLDDQLRASGIGDVDFIKVDTQGSELFVLEGASDTLTRAIGVEAEAEFTPIYKEQPVFADVDAFLRPRGFQLFALRPCYWKRAAGSAVGGPYGQIIWADALYFKTPEALEASLADLAPDARRAKALKAISIAVLYGYQDYAIELARRMTALSSSERAAIDAALRRDEGRAGLLPRFPGRRRLASALYKLWRLCREPTGWSISDADLGNQR
jgi:FkbM family methyltransferase